LIKLTIAAFLWALAAEHWTCVVEFHGLRELLHSVLDVGAAHRRSRLWAQTHRRLVAIFERIHLFADDIRVETNRTLKQFRVLEDRHANFAKAERRENGVCGLLDAIPKRGFRREQIADAFDRLKLSRLLGAFCGFFAHSTGSSR
jgi:hypothetical protein